MIDYSLMRSSRTPGVPRDTPSVPFGLPINGHSFLIRLHIFPALIGSYQRREVAEAERRGLESTLSYRRCIKASIIHHHTPYF